MDLLQEDCAENINKLDCRRPFAPYDQELLEVLDFLKPVDFKAEAEEAGEKKLGQKVLAMLVLDAMLRQFEEDELEQYGIAYCDDVAYIYHSDYWHRIEKEALQCFLRDAAMIMGVNKATAAYYKFTEDLYKQFQVSAEMRAPERDPDRLLLNLQNGTLEIYKGKATLRLPKRSDFLTYKMNYIYEPTAEAPLFRKYLDRVLPEKDRQQLLAIYTAYIMVPGLKWQKVLFMTGDGNNGKSVFVQILKYLIGPDNTEELTVDVLTQPNSKYLVHLEHKLLNISDDNSQVEIMDTGVFKKLARGSAVPVNIMHKHGRVMTDYAKTIVTCNRLPKTKDYSEGFFRSFMALPFSQRIEAEERDPKLADKIIQQELPGVLNWALSQMEFLMHHTGFPELEAATEAVEEYRTEASSVMSFIEDNNVTPDKDNFEYLADTYRAYQYYCAEAGFNKPVSRKTFSIELNSTGRFKKAHTRGGNGFYLRRNYCSSDDMKIER